VRVGATFDVCGVVTVISIEFVNAKPAFSADEDVLGNVVASTAPSVN